MPTEPAERTKDKSKKVYEYRVLLPLLLLLLLCVAILLLQVHCFLLLFVIGCRMAKIVAGSLNLIPVFSLSIQTRCMLDAPLGSPVAITASICVRTSPLITAMRGAKAGKPCLLYTSPSPRD